MSEDRTRSEQFGYEPDVIAFQRNQDNVFDIKVAEDGTTKRLSDGTKMTLTTALFHDISNTDREGPTFANHDPRFGLGQFYNPRVDEDGDLVESVQVDAETADRLRNDAFEGVSIGLASHSLRFSDDGQRIIGGRQRHLSIEFYPNEPVCGKDNCNVLFHKDAKSRSCMCQHDLVDDDVMGYSFSKELYDLDSAKSWAIDNGPCCHDGSADVVETDDSIILLTPSVAETTEDEVMEVSMGQGVMGYIPETSFQQPTIGRSADIDFGSLQTETVNFSAETETQTEEETMEEEQPEESGDGVEEQVEDDASDEQIVTLSISSDDDPEGIVNKMADELGVDLQAGSEMQEEPTEDAGEEEEEEEEMSETVELTPEEHAELTQEAQRAEKLEAEVEDLRPKAERFEAQEEELNETIDMAKQSIAQDMPEIDEDLRGNLDALGDGQDWTDLPLTKLKEYHGLLTTVAPKQKEAASEGSPRESTRDEPEADEGEGDDLTPEQEEIEQAKEYYAKYGA